MKTMYKVNKKTKKVEIIKCANLVWDIFGW